jgi:type II secretion system protein H
LRGFSLIELMVVVVIIAITAALALPNMTKRLRDRKVADATERLAAVYRGARTRAMSRGSAVLVRYTSADQTVRVLEALRGAGGGDGCATLPSSSCLATDWTNAASGQFRELETFSASAVEDMQVLLFPPESTTTPGNFELCYTPLGRSLVRINAPTDPNAFTRYAGVATLRVFKGTLAEPLGLVRTVSVLPNGSARVGTAQ